MGGGAASCAAAPRRCAGRAGASSGPSARRRSETFSLSCAAQRRERRGGDGDRDGDDAALGVAEALPAPAACDVGGGVGALELGVRSGRAGTCLLRRAVERVPHRGGVARGVGLDERGGAVALAVDLAVVADDRDDDAGDRDDQERAGRGRRAGCAAVARRVRGRRSHRRRRGGRAPATARRRCAAAGPRRTWSVGGDGVGTRAPCSSVHAPAARRSHADVRAARFVPRVQIRARSVRPTGTRSERRVGANRAKHEQNRAGCQPRGRRRAVRGRPHRDRAAVELVGRRIDLAILAVMYLATAMGVTVGFHRLLTHRSFRVDPWLERTFAGLGQLSVQGSVLDWVADHRKHHAHTDVEGDPHSPHVGHGSGLGGLWHAHTGWLLETQGQADWKKYARDLYEDPKMKRMGRRFPLYVLASLLIPTVLGLRAARLHLAGRAARLHLGRPGPDLPRPPRDVVGEQRLPLLRHAALRHRGPVHQRVLAGAARRSASPGTTTTMPSRARPSTASSAPRSTCRP